jgi:dTDP-4-amino-4,6-dideoxygalactose transaminase
MGGTVPFVDLARHHGPIRQELAAAFTRVTDTSGFILGEEVQLFEEEFATYCGVEHCIGVNSGTAALTLAMMAGGVGAGDEVIVPAHTFIASALGVIHAGATPVLCDVRDEDGLIDLQAAGAVVGERTAAILAVHLYGDVCDMDAICQFAASRGLALFEDAAQAHGATYRDKAAGSFGSASAFSFYPSKNLGALGDGGAICTDDGELARQARILRNLGQQTKGDHVAPGFNERLDGLQAALLRVKLRRLDGANEARRSHAAHYREVLRAPATVRPEADMVRPVWHLFPVRVPERDRVRARLAGAGVQTGVHYTPALPEQPALRGLVKGSGDYPLARSWAREELSLPMFAELEPQEVQRAAETLNAALCGP